MKGLYTFSKSEKITEKKLIDGLFKPAIFFKAYPIRVHLLPCSTAIWPQPIKVLIVVPKRNLKRANKRNYQKRVLREMYRLSKPQLLKNVQAPHAMAIIYSEKQTQSPAQLQKAWDKIIDQLAIYFKH